MLYLNNNNNNNINNNDNVNDQNVIITDEKDKANFMSHCWEKVHQPHNDNRFNNANTTNIDNWYENILPMLNHDNIIDHSKLILNQGWATTGTRAKHGTLMTFFWHAKPQAHLKGKKISSVFAEFCTSEK